MAENALEAVKPYFCPQNMFDCTFFEQQYCIIWPLITENKQQLEKEKMQNYVILVFFRKKFISKDMKAINYKMKNLNRFVRSSKRSPRDMKLSRICFTSTKRTSNMTKIKNSFTFFVKNACRSH